MKTLSSKSCLIVFCVILVIPFLVSLSGAAQQPQAAIQTFSGDVMVSKLGRPDSPAVRNTVLSQGDAIQVHAGAAAVIELSDGSTIELGEQTMAYFAVLEQSRKARATHLYLLWGRIRTVLTPAHQKKGSSFQVETLNALVNLTFSAPDVEIIYRPETDATIAVAHTVDVSLTNLATGQTKMITRGHAGIAQGQSVEEQDNMMQSLQNTPGFLPQFYERQPIRELLQTFHETRRERELLRHFRPGVIPMPPQVVMPRPEPITPLPEVTQPVLLSKGKTSSPGLDKTKIAIGIGGLAAVVGTGVLIANLNDDNDDDNNDSDAVSFTGVFEKEMFESGRTQMMRFELLQTDTTITGNRMHTLSIPDCGAIEYTVSATGIVAGNTAMLSYPAYHDETNILECPDDSEYSISTEGGTCQAELGENGSVLRLFECSGGTQEDGDYLKQ